MDDPLDHFPEPTHGFFTSVWEASREPPEWVIEDLLPVGVSFLAGPPKFSWKSTIAEAMAATVAGYDVKLFPPFLRNAPLKGETLFFAAEASAGALRVTLEDGLGIIRDEAKNEIFIADDPWKFRLDDPGGVARLESWLVERRPRLLVLDPLRRFHQLDENDSGEMSRLLRPLVGWAHEYRAALLIIHHTSKPSDGQTAYGPMNMRGTSDLFGIADGVIMITPKKETHTINAVFKRAQEWERTFRLGVWGQEPAEILLDLDRTVLQLVRAGAVTADAIAEQAKYGKRQVLDALEKLRRNNLAVMSGNQWRGRNQ